MNMNMYSEPDVLFSVRLVGIDNCCGVLCWLCTGTAAQLDLPKGMLPQQLQGKMRLQELEPFAEEVQKILNDTCDPLPAICWIIPCCDIVGMCCKVYWAGQRQQRLQKAIEKANDQLRNKGYYWALGSTVGSGMVGGVDGVQATTAFLMFKTTNANEMLGPRTEQVRQQVQQQVDAQAQSQQRAQQAQQLRGAMGGVGCGKGEY